MSMRLRESIEMCQQSWRQWQNVTRMSGVWDLIELKTIRRVTTGQHFPHEKDILLISSETHLAQLSCQKTFLERLMTKCALFEKEHSQFPICQEKCKLTDFIYLGNIDQIGFFRQPQATGMTINVKKTCFEAEKSFYDEHPLQGFCSSSPKSWTCFSLLCTRHTEDCVGQRAQHTCTRLLKHTLRQTAPQRQELIQHLPLRPPSKPPPGAGWQTKCWEHHIINTWATQLTTVFLS